MTAVVGENKILFFQLPRKSHGRELLSHTSMNSPIQLAQRKKLQELLLHLADSKGFLKDFMIDRSCICVQNILLVMTGTAGLPL